MTGSEFKEFIDNHGLEDMDINIQRSSTEEDKSLKDLTIETYVPEKLVIDFTENSATIIF